MYADFCVGGTPPPPTPTPTPTMMAGLPSNQRLYGLEYIPFPEYHVGATNFNGLDVTFTSHTANDQPRNTARWVITLKDMGVVGDRIQVETRIGAPGESAATGYIDPAVYQDDPSADALVLPPRPQNLSTTYFWVDGEVPRTEQFDAMGDPRHVPYIDVMNLPASQPFAGGYNYYFRQLPAPYSTYATLADYNKTPLFDDTGDTRFGTNVDLAKLYGLWREAVVKSGSVFNSITGWSNYYFGIGGEIGGDSNQSMDYGTVVYGGPWDNTGSLGVDEIVGAAWGRGTCPSCTFTYDSRLVREKSGPWASIPWLGELWPDSAYLSDWANPAAGGSMATGWGNLRNSRNSGSWYREQWANVSFSSPAFSAPGFSAAAATYGFAKIRHAYGPGGPSTFMNNADANPFNQIGAATFSAPILNAAITMSEDYHSAVPAPIEANRPWNMSSATAIPYDRNVAPYNTSRMTLKVFGSNVSGTRGFYSGGGSYDGSSAALVGKIGSDAGWFIVSGLAPAGQTGINFLARYSIMSSLRTFHDAGVPTVNASGGAWLPGTTNDTSVIGGVFRVRPVPLVEFTSPVNQDPTTSGRPSILLKWRQRYVRWDGQPYTENYPCVDDDKAKNYNTNPCGVGDPTRPGNPALEWHDDADLVFNLKYRPVNDMSEPWRSALSDDPGDDGVLMLGSDVIAEQAGHLYEHTWDVSSFSPGDYYLRVECYRKEFLQHYAYHEIRFRIAP